MIFCENRVALGIFDSSRWHRPKTLSRFRAVPALSGFESLSASEMPKHERDKLVRVLESWSIGDSNP